MICTVFDFWVTALTLCINFPLFTFIHAHTLRCLNYDSCCVMISNKTRSLISLRVVQYRKKTTNATCLVSLSFYFLGLDNYRLTPIKLETYFGSGTDPMSIVILLLFFLFFLLGRPLTKKPNWLCRFKAILSRDYWTVDNANLSRFTRSSYLLD